MHWATIRRHSDLFWAATSTSSQVIPILNKSLLTVLLQFVRGWPGPLLNPGNSQCNACRGMCTAGNPFVSHVQPVESSFTEYVVHTLLSSSDSNLFIFTLSFQEMPNMLLCHLWWAAFSLFVSVAVRGHTSALYRRVDRIIASYNLIFTFRLMHLFFYIFLIVPNTAVAFPIRTLTFFSNATVTSRPIKFKCSLDQTKRSFYPNRFFKPENLGEIDVY